MAGDGYELLEKDTKEAVKDGKKSGESTPRTSVEIVRQYHEVKQRISFAQEQVRSGRKEEGKRTLEDLKREVELDEHRIPLPELLARHSTNVEDGLTTPEHARRLEHNGPNALTPPKTTPEWVKFMLQFTNFFSLLLQSGSILCFIGYALDSADPNNLYLGIVLYVVVVLSSAFGYYQEHKSDKVMEGFKNMITTTTKVRRDGVLTEVDARDLVVGDVVELVAGMRVPADIRIVKQIHMKVDNSALTGESEPQTRTHECTDDNPLETKNLAFFGTLVVDGSCTAIIINCGDDTLMGRIAGLAAGTQGELTPIHKEIDHFIFIISGVAMFLGVFFFVVGFAKGTNWVTNLVFMIGIIVANVPEGLLVTVTLSLTLSAASMAKRNVLVKNLESVETLGSTTTICSDKTGTLTQNRMTVVHVMYDAATFSTNTATTKKTFDSNSDSFKALYRVGALCSRSVFLPDASNMALPVLERRVVGDASEAAILKLCETENAVVPFRHGYKKLAEIPFNSVNKYQLSIHELPDPADNRRLLVIKGATERILDRCTYELNQGRVIALTPERRALLDKEALRMGKFGERVLAFAHLYLDGKAFPADFEYDVDNANFPTEGLTFVGLMGLIDPPREAVPHAVAKCRQAGIRVVMVTGDHPVTAEAIARQVGIITMDTVEDIAERENCEISAVDPSRAGAVVVHGAQMKDLTPEDWTRILDHKEVVFARTSPQQKLLIVEACQRRGEIVAVTGDGVNDSPALKKADIGIAMGISGSDVSKEAADMILLDDNFASIVGGVEVGRVLFDNLKKSIAYTIQSNTPEITPFLSFIAVGIPLPLTTVLILCVDLGTDMVPAISFAYEDPETDLMKRTPRNPAVDRLVTRKMISFSYGQIGIIQTLGGFYTYCIAFNDFGIPPHVLPGMDTLGEWGDKLMWCRFDDFPTYSAGLSYNDVISSPDYPIGSEPTECKWFDDDVAFTPSQYADGVFEDYLPYTVPEYQESRLQYAQTAFFVSIVLSQMSGSVVCKTRKLSLFDFGFSNVQMNLGYLSEIILTLAISYLPFMNLALQTKPIYFQHWITMIPFALFIFCYDETRKYICRQDPEGWLKRHTYW